MSRLLTQPLPLAGGQVVVKLFEEGAEAERMRAWLANAGAIACLVQTL